MSSHVANKSVRRRRARKQPQAAHSHVTQKLNRNERYNGLPSRPIIATRLLEGIPLTFREFIFDPNCRRYLTLLFDENCTAGATMVRNFRFATRGLFFGHRRPKQGRPTSKHPGVLDEKNSASKAALKEFARRAYRGDPERRGPIFWKRMAGLLWNTYDGLMTLRAQSNDIKRREIERISKLGIKRAKGAARVQRHRAKIKAERIKQVKKASNRAI